ncbi:TonB-dependent hemoglobin/transferrin/lactoferrin family receptor [Gallibacterium genomosp. 3]|uniref:TonB-dependent hemoglobin/transferrin/lactoferrin family receptor n=1 Tax=Gallibacterium genomosp. 3 TaxID=505345 RepID=UPI0008026FFB|nr:TonB-dependent hemoglobin/transferrin/lactoferrin family receptor [Gallibacterium genomosp. 3]
MIKKSILLRTVRLSIILFVANPLVVFSQKYDVLPEILVDTENHNKEILSGRVTLNSENIAQQQADNVGSLINVLSGVSMAGSPNPGGQSINIWGMQDSEDVRILLDGNQKNFERYQQGSVFIEPDLLKRVEVDKGNFSARYGNGGFGGTVSFTTKDPSDFLTEDRQLGGLLKYSYHTNDKQNIYSAAVFARNSSKTLDALFYTSIRNGKNITRPDGSQFLFSENDNNSYLFKMNWFPNTKQRITFSAVRFSDEGWTPFAAKRSSDLSVPSASDIAKYGLDIAWKRKLVYRKLKDENYTLNYVYTADNPLVNIEAKFGFARTIQQDQRHELASKFFASSMGNRSWTDYKDWNIELSNTAIFDTAKIKHRLVWGGVWHHSKRDVVMLDLSKVRNQDYNYGVYTPAYMPSGNQYTQSIFIEDQIEWNSWLIKPGLRYDHIKNIGKKNLASIYNDLSAGHNYQSKTYSGWSPFLSLQWNVNKQFSVFSDISKTWRAPVIDEQYEVQYAKANISGSSRDLQKEKITSIRVGTFLTLDNLLLEEDNLQLRTLFFYTRGKDEIFKTRGIYDKTKKPVSNYRNLPGYRIQGVEVEAYYNSTYVFGSFNYSQIKGKRDASPRDPFFPEGTWIAEIPPRTASLSLGVNVPSMDMSLGWRADMVRRQDHSPSDQDPAAGYWSLPKTAGYTLHNVFLTWKPKSVQSLKVYFAVDNIFNKNYQQYLGEKVSGTGRNVKMSVSLQF